MSIITIDTENKTIEMETQRANMVKLFLQDKSTVANSLDRALNLEEYSIVSVTPKKARKKNKGYKISLEEIENIIKSKKDKELLEEFKRLKETKTIIKDKQTGKEKLNKEGKPIYQSNYLIIRNWFFKRLPGEKEKLKNA